MIYIVCPIWAKGGEKIMGYGCCSTSYKGGRSFLTREERVQLLKEYKQDLERETKGVEERIKELEG
jgi:hypothetical protein